jgi:hypothetical protein
MPRKILFFLGFFLVSCVENLVHIQIFDNGSFSVKYNSIGHKNDLLDSDFIHPTSNDKHNWITSLRQTNESGKENIWEKETILSSPTRTKLTFTNSSNLQYDIDVSRNSYFFWDSYTFQSNIKDLEIDLKYPEIVNYLDIDEDDLSWLVPAKRYIFSESIKVFQEKNTIDKIIFDRIDNQIDSYISYIEEKDYEKEFSRKSSEIFIDALSPMKRRLPKNFLSDMTIIIDDLEKEFEKNTNLMLDGFTFSVAIPGDLRNTNATFISELHNTIYWEFDFNDIATSHFNMYAHSIVINNLSLQLLLLIILLVFIGLIWKIRLKKE